MKEFIKPSGLVRAALEIYFKDLLKEILADYPDFLRRINNEEALNVC